jgi:hypothetical protein
MTAQDAKADEHGDPFLDEVRRLKRDAFARSGDKLDKHIEHLREIEKKHEAGVIQPPPPGEEHAA